MFYTWYSNTVSVEPLGYWGTYRMRKYKVEALNLIIREALLAGLVDFACTALLISERVYSFLLLLPIPRM